ncbi:MAG: hypothetical protein KGN04_01855 [Chloroflexi bacterium]|nr:hypothetical protein [Chloroflexota bacterium]
MNKPLRDPAQELLEAYRTREPRRAHDPFLDPATRQEIARIAAARTERSTSGWRSALFGWFNAVPRGAVAGAALSLALLLGGGALRTALGPVSVARMDAGSVPVMSTELPNASADLSAESVGEKVMESEPMEGGSIVTAAALLLLLVSVAAGVITVRRRRA